MSPQDRFCIHHVTHGPVYTSDKIRGVIGYLWGRDTSQHIVYVYEVPVHPTGNLHALADVLYETVLAQVGPQGLETPLD